jgi:tetratricopeptide (TPR) repeat protein
MSRIERVKPAVKTEYRLLLPAVALLAALIAVWPAALAAQPAVALQVSATQTQTPAPTLTPSPLPTATPEEIGDSLMAHQRYQAAIAAFRQSPQNNADVWNKMGIANQMMFNMEEATRCYQRSLRMDPKQASVMNNLGTIYDSLKDYPSAERMYRKALKLEPKSPVILKNLGTSLLAQHKYKKGADAYQAALALDPQIFNRNANLRIDNPSSVQERGAMNYYMAQGCVRAGMTDCAVEYLRMALEEGFTNPKKISADSEFAGLRGVPAFEQLMAEQRNQ